MADETKKRTPPHWFQRGCWIEQASCVAVVLSIAVAGGWYCRLVFVERGLVKGVPPKTARPRGKWNISSFRTRYWEMRGPKGQLTRGLESKSISIFTCKHIQRSEYSQLVSINNKPGHQATYRRREHYGSIVDWAQNRKRFHPYLHSHLLATLLLLPEESSQSSRESSRKHVGRVGLDSERLPWGLDN